MITNDSFLEVIITGQKVQIFQQIDLSYHRRRKIMKFHGIECIGKFVLQKESGPPSFDASRDEGRLLYNTTTKKIHYGTNTS
jgi:hypothetical protein